MEWMFNGEEYILPNPEYVGFIYLITLPDGRKYIGKKKLWNKKTSIKTVTLKNGSKKKKKIRSLIESDWREYWSSSDLIKDMVDKNGTDGFKREILRFCKTESELTYFESKEIFVRGCLESEDYVNGWVMCRIRKSNIFGKI